MADVCTGPNVVTNCTEENLRAAIGAGGLVTLCCNGTITLTNVIEITHDVALDARGRDVVISGGNTVRLFNVSPGVRFSVTNLTLANGRIVGLKGTNGLNQPPPVGYPSGPGSPGLGGAIFNDGGMVELAFTSLTNNYAVGGEGGTSGFEGGAGAAGAGGAVYSQNGSLLLYEVNMSSNVASGGSGGFVQGAMPRGGDGLGGAVYATNSQVLVLNSVLNSNACTTIAGGSAGNASAARGGAVAHLSGSLSISNSVLAANEAIGGSAPVQLLAGFPRPGSAYGGAVAASGGTVHIDRSRLVSNMARGGDAFRHSGTGEAQGGAVIAEATLLVFNSSFTGNQALSGSGSSSNTDGRGGAIHTSGFAVLDGCSLHSNAATGGGAGAFGSFFVNYPGGHALGGGVFNSGQLAATNCTVALNSVAGGRGGFTEGFPGNGLGGGIYNDTNGSFTAMNITVASNSAAAGMGWSYQGTAAGADLANVATGSVRLRNTLLATGGTNGSAWGTITDAGFNMSSDGSANFNSGTSLNSADPRLGPLASYGGPTSSMALRPDSPAIDFGGSGAPATDQRGFSRPYGAGVDIGAYEFHSNQTELPTLSAAYATNSIVVAFETFPGTQYRLLSSSDFSAWVELETVGPFVDPTFVSRVFDVSDGSIRYFRVLIP